LGEVVNLLADPFCGELEAVGFTEGDDAAGGIVESGQETADGGFSGTRGADDVRQIAGREEERDIVEDETIWAAWIGEGNLLSDLRLEGMEHS
jgi:hypothetical protein